MTNDDKRMYTSIPILIEEHELIKQKQISLISKRNRMVPLSEVVSELVAKGLHLVE